MKNIAEIISNNPGCQIIIGNSTWYIYDSNGEKELANWSEEIENGFNGNRHEYDVILALAEIVGVQVSFE